MAHGVIWSLCVKGNLNLCCSVVVGLAILSCSEFPSFCVLIRITYLFLLVWTALKVLLLRWPV